MAITFKDLREATGDLVHNIIGPAELMELKTLARQLSSSYQHSVPMVLSKIENKLNFFAYTMGDLDLEDLGASGEETFFILSTGSQEIAKNAYISLSWEKMASGVASPASDLRADGSSLQYTVRIEIKEASPEEVSNMYGSAINDGGESLLHPDENSDAEENNEEEYKEGENKFHGFKESVNEEKADATKQATKLHKEVSDMLGKIASHHKAHKPAKDSHWGHVGDLGRLHGKVKDIHDLLHKTGEYK